MNHFDKIQSSVLDSPLLGAIIHKWEALALPDCWLVAGAIAQTVWNRTFDLPLAYGISDIDIVYFDPHDLSERSEAQHAARIRDCFSDMPVWIDVKNEARVHLWYEARFGYPIAPYLSTTQAIATFPTTATTIGLQPDTDAIRFEAPMGVKDLLQAIVRPNKKQITRDIYNVKVSRWRTVWPQLCIIDWDAQDIEIAAQP